LIITTVEVHTTHPAVYAVAAAVFAVVVTAVIAVCLYRYVRRRQKKKTELEMKTEMQRLLYVNITIFRQCCYFKGLYYLTSWRII